MKRTPFPRRAGGSGLPAWRISSETAPPMTKHVEVMDLVAQLKAAEEAFVLATVVRTVSVTAAKAGAKAIIRPDGTIVAGWIGGGCARGAVLKAARDALADGEPRMVSVQPENLLAELGVKPGENRDGVRFARTCARARAPWTCSSSRCCRILRWSSSAAARWRCRWPTQARQLGYHVTVAAPAADLTRRAGRRHADRRLCARKAPRGETLRRGLDAGQGRRGRAAHGDRRPRPPITPSSAAAARWRRCATN